MTDQFSLQESSTDTLNSNDEFLEHADTKDQQSSISSRINTTCSRDSIVSCSSLKQSNSTTTNQSNGCDNYNSAQDIQLNDIDYNSSWYNKSEEPISTDRQSIPFDDDDKDSEDFTNRFEKYKKLADLDETQSKAEFFDNLYPIPEDPGLVPGMWILFPKPKTYEPDGIGKYQDLVDEMRVPFIQNFPKMLNSNEINLKFYGLTSKCVRAVCEAASNNFSIEHINLEGNWLDADACSCLNSLLISNNSITTLNLTDCKIGPAGAKELNEGIGLASSLRDLNLTRCALENEGVKYITAGAYCSTTLQSLNLSYNDLDENCAEFLQNMLIQTNSLVKLNLSWNTLFTDKFWTTFLLGLTRNSTLTDLNVSWNNLGSDCIPSLKSYLTNPGCLLKHLDLSDNSFEEEDAKLIGDILRKNISLETFNLSHNFIKPTGAFGIIEALNKLPPASPLVCVDLKDIWVNKKALPLLDTIRSTRPSLNINLAGILSNFEISEPEVRKIYLKRANYEAMKPKTTKLQRNFGHFILSLTDTIISKDEFKNLVTKFGLQLSDSLVEEIMNAFSIGNNTVDQSLLKSYYLKEYPDTTPPPPKPEKDVPRKVSQKKKPKVQKPKAKKPKKKK